MRDSKLIAILRTFSKKEFKDFGRFVYSPFFNRLNNVIKLFDVLKAQYPEFSSQTLTDEKLFESVFPSEKFDYSKFKNLVSDLMGLAEQYLAYIRYDADIFGRNKYLLDELHSRNLDKLFEKNYKETEKSIQTNSVKGEEYYRMNYQLQLLLGTHQFTRKDFSSENRLQIISDNFINYSLIRILKLYTYMINEEIAFKSGKEKLILINEIINHIKEYSYNDVPAVRIYFLILMLTKYGSEAKEYYFELKDIKIRNKGSLLNEELIDIDICLVNFCTRMVLQGSRDFLKEYFELLKESIYDSKGQKTGSVSHFRFMNAVITGLKLGEISWVENFIREFKDALQPEHKDETLGLTMGMVHFSKDEYNEALDQLKKINFDDCHHKMHLRNLTLQIYYELNYYEPAISILDSYKHFLSRERSISEIYKNYNVNFVKYYEQMLKTKMKSVDTPADELLHDVKKSDEFANKDWVLGKLKEIS